MSRRESGTPSDFARRAAAPLLALLAALSLLPGTRTLDAVAREGQLGPGFWPRLVLIGLALACAATILTAWRRRPASNGGQPDLEPISWPRLALAVALIVGYVALAPHLGFALVTLAFIAVFLWVCGTRSPVAIVVHAVLGTVGLLYLFVKLVYLPLPKGDGPFEALTLAVYRLLKIF